MGYDSERGATFIKRMNRMHGQYDISNEDFLYTVSTSKACKRFADPTRDLLPKNKYPQLNTLLQYPTHPDGYTVDDIGPKPLRKKRANSSELTTRRWSEEQRLALGNMMFKPLIGEFKRYCSGYLGNYIELS